MEPVDALEPQHPIELIEKITRENTPAGVVIYRDFFDQHGNLVRRDVEHLVSAILMTQAAASLDPKQEDTK